MVAGNEWWSWYAELWREKVKKDRNDKVDWTIYIFLYPTGVPYLNDKVVSADSFKTN